VGKGATRHGKITSGIAPRMLVIRTIEFVRDQLAPWRDDADRRQTDSEEDLNGQLCGFLNVVSGDSFPMVYFHHEERQTGRRRVDIGARPRQALHLGSRRYTKYQPFLVFEGKRVPAPSRDREREYVTGDGKTSGGIQRFKLGLHGAKLGVAAMIGYVQAESACHWFTTVNGWITELAESPDEPTWGGDERLTDYTSDAAGRTATCRSTHSRVPTEAGDTFRLHHLWVEM